MNIIFFSIFFLRLRIFSRHKWCFYSACGQLLRDSGSLNVGKERGRGKELGKYYRNEKGWSVARVRD